VAISSFKSTLVEYFTLREAAQAVAAIPAETRASALRDLRRAFQMREAAETLWPRGSAAEALKLAVASLDVVRSALAALSLEPPPPWLVRARALADDAKGGLGDAAPPALEREIEAAHEATFRPLVEALAAIEECVGPGLVSPGDLPGLRRARRATAIALGVALVAGLVYWLRPATFSGATASTFVNDSTADKAIDGDTSTGWNLPDHVSQGWIDLALARPRPIDTLRVVTSNPPWNDRSVKDVRIEAILGGTVVKSLDWTFPQPIGRDPNWNEVKLDAPMSDHLRITVKSGYRDALGIAEIELK
jgi:hypothetical protein